MIRSAIRAAFCYACAIFMPVSNLNTKSSLLSFIDTFNVYSVCRINKLSVSNTHN